MQLAGTIFQSIIESSGLALDQKGGRRDGLFKVPRRFDVSSLRRVSSLLQYPIPLQSNRRDCNTAKKKCIRIGRGSQLTTWQ